MTDGDVVGALERFQRAVVGLVDPITGTVEGAVRQAPSLSRGGRGDRLSLFREVSAQDPRRWRQ
jgi:hypothetical protein